MTAWLLCRPARPRDHQVHYALVNSQEKVERAFARRDYSVMKNGVYREIEGVTTSRARALSSGPPHRRLLRC
jgi:hypothetical protein